ncbi:MAG TPA: hypothetical protein VJU79_08960 [Candidatus Dormibacteraeota bacterium]|nr:hypothetical protein [Candidatus Dormibacteraeota bacterium]
MMGRRLKILAVAGMAAGLWFGSLTTASAAPLLSLSGHAVGAQNQVSDGEYVTFIFEMADKISVPLPDYFISGYSAQGEPQISNFSVTSVVCNDSNNTGGPSPDGLNCEFSSLSPGVTYTATYTGIVQGSGRVSMTACVQSGSGGLGPCKKLSLKIAH